MFQHSVDTEQAVRWAFPLLHMDVSEDTADSAVLSVLHKNVRPLDDKALQMKRKEGAQPVHTLLG